MSIYTVHVPMNSMFRSSSAITGMMGSRAFSCGLQIWKEDQNRLCSW